MTDKERLEEIEQIVDDLINNRIELREFIQSSYVQAERVQELEEENKNLEFNLDTTLKNNHEHRLRTASFKEVLQDINENSSCTIAVCYTRKALEGAE